MQPYEEPLGAQVEQGGTGENRRRSSRRPVPLDSPGLTSGPPKDVAHTRYAGNCIRDDGAKPPAIDLGAFPHCCGGSADNRSMVEVGRLDAPERQARFVTAPKPGWIGHALRLDEAQGLEMLCPCGAGHVCIVWFRDRGVPPERVPGPGRWAAAGSGLGDLTLDPSIAVGPVGRECWHGYVQGGIIRTC